MSSAILGTDPALRDEALHHLAIDTGISELMPYFVQMASERVTAGLGNLDLVGRMLAVLEALLNNPEVDVDPYVSFPLELGLPISYLTPPFNIRFIK